MSCNHVTSFPWLLCILSVGILIATGVYSARVNSENDHIKTIFDLLKVNINTAKDVSNVLKWGTTLAWCLTVVAIGGTIVSVIITFMADARSASYRQGNKKRKPGCVSYSTSRVLVSVILLLSYLTCVVTVALIVLQALVLTALKATNVAANGAQDLLNEGLQAASGLSSSVISYLGTAKTEVQGVISTLSGCSSQDVCQQAINKLNDLNSAIDTVNKNLGSITGAGNCAPGCLDISQLWFVDKSKANTTESCVCDSVILNQLETESDQGFNSAIGAAVAIVVALLLWLLFFSKVSMNSKALAKDQAWSKALHEREQEVPASIYRDDFNSSQLPPTSMYQHPPQPPPSVYQQPAPHVKPVEAQAPVVYQDDYNVDSAQLPPPAHFYHEKPGKPGYHDPNNAV